MSHAADKPANGHHDIEMQGGPIGRQLSIQLTSEQFEKLYLQPGGQAAKGDLAKRLGNPTALGLISFLLCLTPVSCFLMGFGDSDATSNTSNAGSFILIGGVGLYVAGILEFILGNTFPFVVFFSFGGYWTTFGFLNSPIQNITGAYAAGAESPAFNSGIAIWLVCWGVYDFILFVASLRTNVVFAILFFVLDIAFFLLAAAYFQLGYGNASFAGTLLKAGGAFAFLTTLCGWYLLVVLLLGATGFPCPLPVGDLSGFLKKKNT